MAVPFNAAVALATAIEAAAPIYLVTVAAARCDRRRYDSHDRGSDGDDDRRRHHLHSHHTVVWSVPSLGLLRARPPGRRLCARASEVRGLRRDDGTLWTIHFGPRARRCGATAKDYPRVAAATAAVIASATATLAAAAAHLHRALPPICCPCALASTILVVHAAASALYVCLRSFARATAVYICRGYHHTHIHVASSN